MHINWEDIKNQTIEVLKESWKVLYLVQVCLFLISKLAELAIQHLPHGEIITLFVIMPLSMLLTILSIFIMDTTYFKNKTGIIENMRKSQDEFMNVLGGMFLFGLRLAVIAIVFCIFTVIIMGLINVSIYARTFASSIANIVFIVFTPLYGLYYMSILFEEPEKRFKRVKFIFSLNKKAFILINLPIMIISLIILIMIPEKGVLYYNFGLQILPYALSPLVWIMNYLAYRMVTNSGRKWQLAKGGNYDK